jgi:hypothetical protein
MKAVLQVLVLQLDLLILSAKLPVHELVCTR